MDDATPSLLGQFANGAKPLSTSESKAGAVAAFVLALCFAAAIIMLTIKLGLVLFT